VACTRHGVLLADRCPACGGAQRVLLPGGLTAPPASTCTRLLAATGQRCGADLTQILPTPCSAPVLAAVRWIEHTISPADAADLPVVAGWLLRRHAERTHGATGRHPRVENASAAALAAVLAQAHTILGPDPHAAIAALREILAQRPSRARIPPPGMSPARWARLSGGFPSRFLRAADPELGAVWRLRMRSLTPGARRPDPSAPARIRYVPQLLWPEWTARLIPRDNTMRAETLAVAGAACLLVPGDPSHAFTRGAARLNPRLNGRHVSQFLKDYGRKTGALHALLTVLCRIADHLDAAAGPIDYQRRREAIPDEPINWPTWRTIALDAGAHPGPGPGRGRHLHAQRHLHQLITGADLANIRHPVALRTPAEHCEYFGFLARLTPPLRAGLRRHAQDLLAGLGIDEPLHAPPPTHLAAGLLLPGIDPDEIDLAAVRHTVIDQRRPLSRTAAVLGVGIDHVRLALERIERPSTRPDRVTTAWTRDRHAATLFTREFFEREYLQAGKRLEQLARETGHRREAIGQWARRAGIALATGAAAFPIHPHWLREQYIARHRSSVAIAAELGTSPSTVNKALRRNGIPIRPPGTERFPHLTADLGPDIPADIHAALHDGAHGWIRLHRFRAAIAFPSMRAAATALPAPRPSLAAQIRRLEHDIGTPLYHRATPARPQHPTERGQQLLNDLTTPRVKTLMDRALRPPLVPASTAANQRP
jgi:hypothetical protein